MNRNAWFVITAALIAVASCSSNSSESAESSTPAEPGKKVFTTYCVTCHGADGKMGLNGAKDLTQSTLTKEETIQVVTNGRKMMAPYKSILSPQEISEVSEYVMKFRR